MSSPQLRFNAPPGWPNPPEGWVPPKGWNPDPSWPAPPPGWQLWVSVEANEVGRVDPDPDYAPAPAHREDLAAVAPSSDVRDMKGLTAENAALREQVQRLRERAESVIQLDDERVLQDVGIYRYHHPLESAVAYQTRLNELATEIAGVIKTDGAIERSNMFTLDGSLAKGRAMTSDLSKLMLRAYNAEAENVVRCMRVGNWVSAVKRLDASRAAIANLGKMMEMRISDAFHALRVKEIELTADYLMKREEERDAARAERERLREERKVALELAAAREKLEKERAHLVTVLDRLHQSGTSDPALEDKLEKVNGAIAQNDYRAANIRAGYVYVISNRGAFGGHVMKIGMTRRLEPLERIHELGDASVPFRFDVHALFFSDDAVTLERQLHEHFASRRMNWANDRKEFFFASPATVKTVLTEKLGNLLEYVDQAESTEYLQSLKYWPVDSREGKS